MKALAGEKGKQKGRAQGDSLRGIRREARGERRAARAPPRFGSLGELSLAFTGCQRARGKRQEARAPLKGAQKAGLRGERSGRGGRSARANMSQLAMAESWPLKVRRQHAACVFRPFFSLFLACFWLAFALPAGLTTSWPARWLAHWMTGPQPAGRASAGPAGAPSWAPSAGLATSQDATLDPKGKRRQHMPLGRPARKAPTIACARFRNSGERRRRRLLLVVVLRPNGRASGRAACAIYKARLTIAARGAQSRSRARSPWLPLHRGRPSTAAAFSPMSQISPTGEPLDTEAGRPFQRARVGGRPSRIASSARCNWQTRRAAWSAGRESNVC